MQSISMPDIGRRDRLLVVELWGVGDLALSIPFLQEAARHVRVTLVAKPHAAPLVRRFCPAIELVPFTAPWTAFSGKYRLHEWPWEAIAGTIAGLRHRRFDAAVSGRHDPRDHVLMALANARVRAGFARTGSRAILTDAITPPDKPHRAEHWRSLAGFFGWEIGASPARGGSNSRKIVVHTGAGHPVREWPRERFDELARHIQGMGFEVTLLDNSANDLDRLMEILTDADGFIGNDSGPGHLAALLGVPTFTIFGPQLPELFAPRHPDSRWIEGAPCHYRPCFDSCRFATPHCIRELDLETVWSRIDSWLGLR